MRIIVPVALLLPLSLSAQSLTLPSGYQNRPGEYLRGDGVLYPFGRSVNFDYQEVHHDWNGRTLPALTAIGFRRAPNRVANTTAVAHTIDATVTMGPGDVNAFTSTFATNYTAPSTVVFSTRTINMPDWTQPIVPRETFSLWLPLDAPYTVDTSRDFVWQLLVQNSTLPNVNNSLYNSDRTATTSASSVSVGAGCVATGRAAAMTLSATFTNSSTTTSLAFLGANYPAGVPVILHVGLTNPNLQLPGLCGRVYAMPDLALPAGPTSASGALAQTTLALPRGRALRSAHLFLQALAPDAGQAGLPLALSEGCEGGLPPGTGVFKYIYSLSPPSAIGSGPFTAGSVITAYQ